MNVSKDGDPLGSQMSGEPQHWLPFSERRPIATRIREASMLCIMIGEMIIFEFNGYGL